MTGENTTEVKDAAMVNGLDPLAARLQALKGLAGVGKYADFKLTTALPVRGPENEERVEYYPVDYARRKFAGRMDIKNFPKLITDTEGTTRPLPQAFNDIEVEPTLDRRAQRTAREKEWNKLKKALDFNSAPSNGKDDWDMLKRDDPRAWYNTPNGKHRTLYLWSNPEKAGRDLPTFRITRASTNSRKSRTVGVWENDSMVAGKKVRQLIAEFGASNVEVKNTNHVFRSIAEINKRGEHEAQRLLARVSGKEIRYNKHLPDAVVEHKNHLVSVADIRNKDLWKAHPVLEHLNEKLDHEPGSLRIGISNREGDSLHNPRLMQETDKEHFETACNKFGLEAKELAKNGKFFEGGPVWVLNSDGILENGSEVKDRLAKGEKLTAAFKPVQIFGASKIVANQIRGSAKSLYATTRDEGAIPVEVAKILETAPRTSAKQAFKEDINLKRQAAMSKDMADHGDSSDDEGARVKQEPTSARQSLIDGRADAAQRSHGL